MRVVMNSDVLFWERPPRGIPHRLRDFCQQSAAVGARIVLPRTVVLECQRLRSEAAEDHKTQLRNATILLASFGVTVPPFDPEALAVPEDLPDLLTAAGARVELVDPLLEDYVEAERRASLHLSPQASKKADEMRDLVIWALSLRIARESGRAMLVSRDEVHSGNLGKDEASTNGLLRASSLEDALELLGRETPAGSLARTLLAAVWQPLREAGLPITPGVVIRRLERLSFLADAARLPLLRMQPQAAL